MDTSALQEAKIRARELDSSWAARSARRAVYVGVEAIAYIISLGLLLGLAGAVYVGHRFPVAEVSAGPTHARATVEDDRVTMLLYAGYALLFLASVSLFFIARLVRSARMRREQVHGLCEAVERI